MSESTGFSALLNGQSHPDLGHWEDQSLPGTQIILPAQFFSRRTDQAEMEPFQRLAFAVLIDAVQCFQRNFSAKQHHKRLEFLEAKGWLFGKTEGPFSFENVCYLVDTDPRWVRRTLRQWQQMKVAGLAPLRSIRRSPVARRSSVLPHRSKKRFIQRASA